MKKRLLSLLLILCLCAALLPAVVFAEDNVTIVTTEDQLKQAVANGGTIQLGEKIELTSALEIKNTVILDLNGKMLTKKSVVFSCAIRVTGSTASLTLTDSSQNETGKICDFFTETLGGGVYVDGGSFIMNGGTIDSCSGQSGGGGVYLTNGASFTLNDGTIKGCTANERALGGGVYVDSDCTFIMEGGAIDSCKSASGAAGGVYAAGTFIMNGGEIRGCYTGDGGSTNATNGGGVCVAPSGKFEMSDGSIENCHTGSGGKGGGVYVGGTFTMIGGTIKNNAVNKAFAEDGAEGAGVYVANGANATLIEANIADNKRTSYKSDRPLLDDPKAVTDNISTADGVEWKEYTPSVDPDYPLISILPALAKDLPFMDVKSTDWFYNDVKYAYETGLMTGTASDAFSPEAPVTRGMVMTILARREGIRTDRYTPWYAAGCEWAKANGISDGSNPEAPVTREQLAAMLYRYAALKGRDLTAGENTNILSYTDAFDISDYAYPALRWATGEKILTGSNGALSPQAPATRAQLAAILHRYFG